MRRRDPAAGSGGRAQRATGRRATGRRAAGTTDPAPAPEAGFPPAGVDAGGREVALARLREICRALPGVEERESHGSPCFFLGGKRQVAAFDDHHHGAERIAVWCPQPEGDQAVLVEMDPELYFVPPYVGVRGWIGMRLDRDPDWDEVRRLLERACRHVTPVPRARVRVRRGR